MTTSAWLPSFTANKISRDFYHQGLRRAITGPADAFVDKVIGLSRRTLLSRYLRLVLAFAISGLIHGIAEASTRIPLSQQGHFLFFSSQAFIIMLEDAIKGVYRRSRVRLPALVERLIGYTWVAGWLFCLVPYWAYSSVQVATPMPSSIAPLLANLLGLKSAL